MHYRLFSSIFFTKEFFNGTILAVQQSINEHAYSYIKNIPIIDNENNSLNSEYEYEFYDSLNIDTIDSIVVSVFNKNYYPDDKYDTIVQIIEDANIDLGDYTELSTKIENDLSCFYTLIHNNDDKLKSNRIEALVANPLTLPVENNFADQFNDDHCDIENKNTKYRKNYIHNGYLFFDSSEIDYDNIDKTDYDNINNNHNKLLSAILNVFINNSSKFKERFLAFICNYYNSIKNYGLNEIINEKFLNEQNEINITDEDIKKSRIFNIFNKLYDEISKVYIESIGNIVNLYKNNLEKKSSSSYSSESLEFIISNLDKIKSGTKKYFNVGFLYTYMLLIFGIILENYNILHFLLASKRIFPASLDRQQFIDNIIFRNSAYQSKRIYSDIETKNLLYKILNTNLKGFIKLNNECILDDEQLAAISLSKYDAFSHYFSDQDHQYDINFAIPCEDMFYCNYKKYIYQVSGEYVLKYIQHSVSSDPYIPSIDGPQEILSTIIPFSTDKIQIATEEYDKLGDAADNVRNKYENWIKSIGNGQYARKIYGSAQELVCGESRDPETLFEISCPAITCTCDDKQYIISCDKYNLTDNIESVLKSAITSSAYRAISSVTIDSSELSCNALCCKCDPEYVNKPDLCALAEAAYGNLNRTNEKKYLNILNKIDLYKNPKNTINTFLTDYLNNRFPEESCFYHFQKYSDYYGTEDLTLYKKINYTTDIGIRINTKNIVYVLIICQAHHISSKNDVGPESVKKCAKNLENMIKFLYSESSIKVIYRICYDLTRASTINELKTASMYSNVIIANYSHGIGAATSRTKSEGIFCTDWLIFDEEISTIFANTDNVVFLCDSCFAGGMYNYKGERNSIIPIKGPILQNKQWYTPTKKINNFVLIYSATPVSVNSTSTVSKYGIENPTDLLFMFAYNKNLTYNEIAYNFNQFIVAADRAISGYFLEYVDGILFLANKYKNIISPFILTIFRSSMSNNPTYVPEYGKLYGDLYYLKNAKEKLYDSNQDILIKSNISFGRSAGTEKYYSAIKYNNSKDKKIIEIVPCISAIEYIRFFISKINITWEKIVDLISDEDIIFSDDIDKNKIEKIVNALMPPDLFSNLYEKKDEVKNLFADDIAYRNNIDRYPIFYDEPEVKRYQLRYLTIVLMVKITIIIVSYFMQTAFAKIENKDKEPKIKKYLNGKKYYENLKNVSNKQIFGEIVNATFNNIIDNLPGMCQCQGNSAFMDQPFLRFV